MMIERILMRVSVRDIYTLAYENIDVKTQIREIPFSKRVTEYDSNVMELCLIHEYREEYGVSMRLSLSQLIQVITLKIQQ
jgi:hypothetical protein